MNASVSPSEVHIIIQAGKERQQVGWWSLAERRFVEEFAVENAIEYAVEYALSSCAFTYRMAA